MRVPRCKCTLQEVRDFDVAVTVDPEQAQDLGLAQPLLSNPQVERDWRRILVESWHDFFDPLTALLKSIAE